MTDEQHGAMRFPRGHHPAVLRLLCVPHAGASAATYAGWQRRLPEWVEVVAVELPGRGARAEEPLCSSIQGMAEEVCTVAGSLPPMPSALFGHSMGSWVALEAARRLGSLRTPVAHLFVSGRNAPGVGAAAPPTPSLPDRELVEAVAGRYGGLPEEILHDPEALRDILPVLRSDLLALEAYAYARHPPLDAAITAFAGAEDRWTTPHGLEAWRTETRAWFRVQRFPGGHFYLHDQASGFLEALAEELSTSRAEHGL